MTFGGASIAYANVNLTTTSPTDNLPCIAVLWDDWEPLPVGTDGVYYKTTGAAGSRQFIVQWNKLGAVNGDGTNTVIFEARLFEGSNRILFSYFDTAISDETTSPPDAARSGVGATVGIRDINGQTSNRNLQWSYNQAVITNGLNLLFAPPNRSPSKRQHCDSVSGDSRKKLRDGSFLRFDDLDEYRHRLGKRPRNFSI